MGGGARKHFLGFYPLHDYCEIIVQYNNHGGHFNMINLTHNNKNI